MSLPGITAPSGTPPFRAAGHGIAPGSVFADVPMLTGHARRRRVWRTVPRVVDVEWRLTQAEMAVVDAWFEDVLQAGNRRFSALIANQGTGDLWWEAQWLSPYRADPIAGGRWRVTGQLLLTGEGSATGPVTTDLQLAITVALTGPPVVLTVTPALALEIVVRLTQPVVLGSINFGAALEAGTGSSYLLLESGDRLLLESGDALLLEA